ncbi:MAG: Gx transporter family protein [Lachnospiraceae bacterium]
MSIKKMTILAVFTTISLTIFMIESTLPALAPIPGIKLGLSNIVTLVVLALFGWKEAGLVLFMRIFLSCLFTGQIIYTTYSVMGGVFCYITMTFFHWLFQHHFIFLTSIMGAIAHNIGQILAAYLLVWNGAILVYLPILLISAVLTGLFTGLCAHFFIRQFKKLHL